MNKETGLLVNFADFAIDIRQVELVCVICGQKTYG